MFHTDGSFKFIRSLTLTVLLCAVCVLFAQTSCCAATKNVLFINSYSYDFDTVPTVINGVKKELAGVASIHYLFMNTKYISVKMAEQLLAAQLDVQMKEFRYDAVILGDDTAFDFAMRYRRKYFRDIPIIFEDINSEAKAQEAAADPQIAGLVETFPMRGTIELARTVMPEAKRVVVITDDTLSARGSVQQCHDAMKYFPGLAWETLDCSKLCTKRIVAKAASYGPETILIFTVFSVDGSGRHYSLPDGVRLITGAAKVPVFRADESGIGEGLFGGYVLKYDSIGRKTGAMVRGILEGTSSTAQLGCEKGECGYKFDFAVMKKFGVKKSQLPESSEFLNDEPDFWERHKVVLLPVGVIALLLLAITLHLAFRRRRKFRQELARSEQARRSAEEASKAKTDFFSKMSHDIRTPLNAIIGLTALSLEDSVDAPMMKDSLRKVHSAGELLLTLINNILDMSKIESGKVELSLEPCALSDFRDNISSIFDSLCRQKGVDFRITGNAFEKTVMLDRLRFSQLVCNLISNAVKFTEAGGSVRFDMNCGPAAGCLLPCDLLVADTGCGMSAEFQKHMFEPYVQETDSSAAGTGTGLGLTIAKRLTELMKGTIKVESKKDVGTKIYLHFELPEAESTAELQEQNGGDNRVSLKGRRVLLVEDNDLNTEIGTLMLQKVGVTVEHAADGKEAVEMFKASAAAHYDALLMDIRMPVMDGLAASGAIRALGGDYAATVPIIAMTADAFDDDIKRSLAAGMNAHITKPVEPDKLYRVLRRYMK
jgi:signal transduction histidine kinase/ABC-type uncharacterized transport system substrate-binding protein/BarA-like signal transduction histidine kinase